MGDPRRSHHTGWRSQREVLEEPDYSDWKCLIGRMPSDSPKFDTPVLNSLWSGALKILDGNSHESHQQLVKDLVDDRNYGSYYLRQTLGIRFEIPPSWHDGLDIVENFLRSITHPAVLDSLSLETHVETLYNVISGSGSGEKVMPFLIYVCRGMMFMSISDQHSDHWDGCVLSLIHI